MEGGKITKSPELLTDSRGNGGSVFPRVFNRVVGGMGGGGVVKKTDFNMFFPQVFKLN